MSTFVAVTWLCGSACDVYHGDSLKHEQRELPAIAASDPRQFHNFERKRFPNTFDPQLDLDNDSASSSKPPVAGTQASREEQAPDVDRPQHEQLEDEDSEDAGPTVERSMVPAVLDAGAGADAGNPMRIETGRPSEVDAGKPLEVDAGPPRPVAKVSAACRGELGFETAGRCYFVLDAPVSWNVGRDRCYEHDAHLASVTSERESDLIASFELEHDVWIGFSRFGAATFSWLTNESGAFSNWKEGAPRAMQESGALIAASTGLWTNRAVSELHAALCETERKPTQHVLRRHDTLPDLR